MNYIPQIAKMLGVEIGEEFTINNPDLLYRFTENKLQFKAPESDWENALAVMLRSLIEGEFEIVKKPWKPEPGDEWFTVCTLGGLDVNRYLWAGTEYNWMAYRLGNCYRTREEAEANLEKWKRFYSDDRPIDWEA